MDGFLWLPLAYVDPNTGFQIFSQASPILAAFLAFLGILLWPFRQGALVLWHFIKNRPKLFLGVLVFLISVGTAFAYHYLNKEVWRGGEVKKIMILGMDGLDPNIMEKMMEEGALPNFKMLKEKGSYSRLGTVVPPQSPVAWSTFATGLNPGGHGLYDFLWRHTENYMPDLALSELVPGKSVKILGKEIPLGGPKFKNRQKGTTLWSYTSQAGVPTTVIHCPVTFPPEKVSGALLAGMGVPDIRGTQGIYSLYTDEMVSGKTQGGKHIPVKILNGTIKTFLRGPRGEGGRDITRDLTIQIEPDGKGAQLSWLGGAVSLKLGQWSSWSRVTFPIYGTKNIVGMTRFYLKALTPHFELYASPFNFTPENPVHPIAFPSDYAKRIQEAIGDFHTLGMPHDTWALNEGAMTDEMFLEQSQTILEEEKAMLRYELPQFESGLFVFVVETPDRIQHMFWRAVDPKSPLYTKELAKRYGNVIADTYREMDRILSLTMEHVDEDTLIMVVSDHGFKSFRRTVHINSWLRENGFLVLQKGYEGKGGGEFFRGVDWSKSRAYAVGLGSIYLNLRGREKQGIVNPGAEADMLKREIAAQLKEFKDPKTNQTIVREAYLGDEIFKGEMISDAPDLLIGFEDGYRASWQTALGASPLSKIEDNMKKWSGDHIVDHRLVPGIFFSNKKLDKLNPTLYDLSPTILSLFDIAVPKEQSGLPLFNRETITSAGV